MFASSQWLRNERGICVGRTRQRTIIQTHNDLHKGTGSMQKITPFLWFDGQAEEAMRFYVSIFKNSSIGSISRYGEAGPGPKGSVMFASFQLEGQQRIALNVGLHYKFPPDLSLLSSCEAQAA